MGKGNGQGTWEGASRSVICQNKAVNVDNDYLPVGLCMTNDWWASALGG